MIGERERKLKISSRHFGNFGADEIYEYALSNGQIEVKIINYGCIIRSIEMPDRNGVKKNVVAGFDNLDQYLEEHPYFGCVIGRFANRISGGRFSIGGDEYNLPVNDGNNHLHGGINGFDKKVWKLERTIENNMAVGISLSYLSKDIEEGYPGNLTVTLTYTLTSDDIFIMHYKARTDKPTIINLTNHSYFNLSGFNQPTIYDHYLQIMSNSYLIKTSDNVPSGKIASLKNTALDFTTSRRLGDEIMHSLVVDKGYDHCFIINNKTGEVGMAAILEDKSSGRLLKVFTDQPCLQLYTANGFNGTLRSGDVIYHQHSAVALEPQRFPDAPNHPLLPTAILHPAESYNHTSIFQFHTTDIR